MGKKSGSMTHSKTKGTFASSEKDAIIKLGQMKGYTVQSSTRIHDNFYHVRYVANSDFTKMRNDYKAMSTRKVI